MKRELNRERLGRNKSTNTNLYECTKSDIGSMQPQVHKKDLLFPELSYKIMGCAFEVFNEIGFGHPEKFYQRALAEALRKNGLPFTEQLYFPVKFNDKIVGKMFFDFLVEDKIIIELKKEA